jgi:hypothetical protein
LLLVDFRRPIAIFRGPGGLGEIAEATQRMLGFGQ